MDICLSNLLRQSSERHSHLCPRQVLGVRIGLAGLRILGLEAPINRSKGLIIIETDGCFADGIEAATGATIGHRTLRVNDYGKIAATFANIRSGMAIRISPNLDIRALARQYTPNEDRHYSSQLEGYKVMPDEDLLHIQEVLLNPTLDVLISSPGKRLNCDYCGEEIINEREVHSHGNVLCRTCASQGYYLLGTKEIEIQPFVNSQSD